MGNKSIWGQPQIVIKLPTISHETYFRTISVYERSHCIKGFQEKLSNATFKTQYDNTTYSIWKNAHWDSSDFLNRVDCGPGQFFVQTLLYMSEKYVYLSIGANKHEFSGPDASLIDLACIKSKKIIQPCWKLYFSAEHCTFLPWLSRWFQADSVIIIILRCSVPVRN